MTRNKITKEVADRAFSHIDSNNIDINNIKLLKQFFKNEFDVTLFGGNTILDNSVSSRNVVCFSNMCAQLARRNFKEAWFELQDMLDYHKPEDYLSINEVTFIDAALKVFLMEYGLYIENN